MFFCFSHILEFQKCVLKKMVEIMQEVKRIGGAEPSNSTYHIRRMERIEELNVLEEKLQNNEERHVLVKNIIIYQFSYSFL